MSDDAKRRAGRWIVGVLMLIVVAVAVTALRHILSNTSRDEIDAAIRRIGSGRLLLSLAITAL
ncbi:hypothetical protein ACPWML_26440, partial [Pandoraea pneumonica]